MEAINKVQLKNIFLLVQGQFITNLGGHLYDVAMLLWLKELTGSAALMGLAMLFTSLPEAILAPIGGAVADRRGQVRTMVVSDLISGLTLFMILAAIWIADDPAVKVAALIFANLILGLCSACFTPSVTSLVPLLAPEGRLEQANAAQQFAGMGGRLVGHAAGGLVFAALDALWAVGLNAVSFILSAISEFFIRPGKHSAINSMEARESLVTSTFDSLKKIWIDSGMRRLILGIAVFHFCLSSLPVLMPFLAEHRLLLEGKWLGLLYVSYTGGIMLGFILAGLAAGRIDNRGAIIACAASLVGFFFFAVGFSTSVWTAVPSLAGTGMGIGIIVVNLMTELQLSAHDFERGRIMGAAQAVGGSSLPIGMALFGLLLDLLNKSGLAFHAAVSLLLSFSGAAAVLVGLLIYFSVRTKS